MQTVFEYGVNVVAICKNDHKYAMSCSWAMQVDYDKICLQLGEQSVTGQNIKPGDLIGVSVLNKDQKNIACIFGEGHSDVVDKFKNIEYTIRNSAITINGARIKMIVEVIDVLHLQEIETDNLVYARIKECYEDKNIDFLRLQDL